MSVRPTNAARSIPLDPLSEVLQDLRLSGVSYGHCRLARPWGVEFEADQSARLHLVVAGVAWIRSGSFGSIRLEQGDVAFLPTGVPHALADEPGGQTVPLSALPSEEVGDRTFRIRKGRGSSGVIMACCNVVFGQPALNPLLALMPKVIHVKRAVLNDPVVPGLLDAMSSEVLDQRVGAATVLARLADVVITRLIRSWAEHEQRNNHEQAAGWLAAIRDPKIGKALVGMHRNPERPWTVDSLAKRASLSRSMFSERFTKRMGIPPAHYLATWRMHLASGWLRNDRFTVSQVSEKLGYESETSFSRAFKRHVGVPPSTLRRVRTRPQGPLEGL